MLDPDFTTSAQLYDAVASLLKAKPMRLKQILHDLGPEWAVEPERSRVTRMLAARTKNHDFLKVGWGEDGSVYRLHHLFAPSPRMEVERKMTDAVDFIGPVFRRKAMMEHFGPTGKLIRTTMDRVLADHNGIYRALDTPGYYEVREDRSAVRAMTYRSLKTQIENQLKVNGRWQAVGPTQINRMKDEIRFQIDPVLMRIVEGMETLNAGSRTTLADITQDQAVRAELDICVEWVSSKPRHELDTPEAFFDAIMDVGPDGERNVAHKLAHNHMTTKAWEALAGLYQRIGFDIPARDLSDGSCA